MLRKLLGTLPRDRSLLEWHYVVAGEVFGSTFSFTPLFLACWNCSGKIEAFNKWRGVARGSWRHSMVCVDGVGMCILTPGRATIPGRS